MVDASAHVRSSTNANSTNELVRIAVFWVVVCAAVLLLNRLPAGPLTGIAFAPLVALAASLPARRRGLRARLP